MTSSIFTSFLTLLNCSGLTQTTSKRLPGVGNFSINSSQASLLKSLLSMRSCFTNSANSGVTFSPFCSGLCTTFAIPASKLVSSFAFFFGDSSCGFYTDDTVDAKLKSASLP